MSWLKWNKRSSSGTWWSSRNLGRWECEALRLFAEQLISLHLSGDAKWGIEQVHPWRYAPTLSNETFPRLLEQIELVPANFRSSYRSQSLQLPMLRALFSHLEKGSKAKASQNLCLFHLRPQYISKSCRGGPGRMQKAELQSFRNASGPLLKFRGPKAPCPHSQRAPSWHKLWPVKKKRKWTQSYDWLYFATALELQSCKVVKQPF